MENLPSSTQSSTEPKTRTRTGDHAKTRGRNQTKSKKGRERIDRDSLWLVNQWQSKRPRYVWRNVSLETFGNEEQRTEREKEKKERKEGRMENLRRRAAGVEEATIIYWRLSHHDSSNYPHHHRVPSASSFFFFSLLYGQGGPFFLLPTARPSPTAVMSFFYLLIHFCRARLHKAFAFLYSLSVIFHSFSTHSFHDFLLLS